jgi:hypothetical protein
MIAHFHPKSYVFTQVQRILNGPEDAYTRMNALRDWFNQTFPTFEFYLEDVWNEYISGETHFEYIIRSRDTREETGPIAYDVYLNHQDTKGVWHLDDYQTTVITTASPDLICTFLNTNGYPWGMESA